MPEFEIFTYSRVAHGGVAEKHKIKSREASRPGDSGSWVGSGWISLPVGRNLPHREAHLDIFIHAVQRWASHSDARRFLCPDRLERVATLGISAHRGGNEFDRDLCDELDDG